MASVFQEEFLKFCKKTSVRGIPRVVNSKSRIVSVFWLVAFLTCFAVMSWQITVIVSRYFQHQVNTVIVQAPSWQKPLFPDVTACNLNPLIYEIKNGSNTYLEFIYLYATQDGLDNIIVENPNFTTSEADRFAVEERSDAMPYFNTFPVNDSFVSESQSESLILNCFYFDWNYNRYAIDCTSTVIATRDPTYYKCYTIGALLDDVNRTEIAALQIFLYVKEPTSQMWSADPSLRSSLASGVRILVHEANTAPYMTGGMSVSPGTESTVLVKQTTRQRQPAPYSNCTDGTGWLENQGYAYSVQYCVDTCIQEKIVRECECIESDFQFSKDQMFAANFTICENVTLWYWYTRVTCAQRVRGKENNCTDICTLPCMEQIYDATLSSASWPDKWNQNAFIYSVAQNSELYPKMNEAYNDLEMNSLNYSDLVTALEATGLIRDHFLQLNVLFGSTAYTELVDVVAFPIDSMGAQTAGVLAFWLGLTVMFICEIAEFIYSYCKSKKRPVANQQGNHLEEVVTLP